MQPTRRSVLKGVGGVGVSISGLAHGERALRRTEAQEEVRTVRMSSQSGNSFDPVGLHVQPRDEVVWELESGAHSTTAYEDRIPEAAETWDSGVLADEGETFSYTFEEEGTYDYYCLPHRDDGMVGRIVVGEPGGPAEESPLADGPLPESDRIVEEQSIPADALQARRGIRITFEGKVAPGNRVTLTATHRDEPVKNANVFVKDGDGERRLVGKTDDRGRITVTVPARGDKAGELNVKIRKGELEGELEVEPDEVEGREGVIRIDVRGTVAPGETVTIIATRNGKPVPGASVFVKDGDGDRMFVGRTDDRGKIRVTVPARGDKAGELDVRVRKGELEGELEIDRDDDDRDDRDGDDDGRNGGGSGRNGGGDDDDDGNGGRG